MYQKEFLRRNKPLGTDIHDHWFPLDLQITEARIKKKKWKGLKVHEEEFLRRQDIRSKHSRSLSLSSALQKTKDRKK